MSRALAMAVCLALPAAAQIYGAPSREDVASLIHRSLKIESVRTCTLP